MLPEAGANGADGPGLVYIVNQQEMALKGGLQTEIIYPDEARVLFAESGPRNHVLMLSGLQPDNDKAGEVLGLATLGLTNLDVSFFGKYGCINEVHLIAHNGGQHSLGKGYRKWYRIVFGQFTDVVHSHLQDATFGDLAEQAAQLLGQGQIGPDPDQHFPVHGWDIHRVADSAGLEVINDLVGHCHRNVLLGLISGGTEMRGGYDVVHIQ